ncbi:SDR family NAD(P)-dependent oxidoreductase [Kineococcus sp. SYSU DK001]|uniref:SDR family NAD(P)-dependent oxidoreductase n=1 Tax=Kineococcus sp. SYSU DK001 TaxID=3383122 RepID=UPI003D7E75F6
MSDEARRVAVVTGAGRGLGRTIAQVMHREGYSVVVTGLKQQAVEDVAAGLDPSGATAFGTSLDVREKSEFEAVLAQTVERFGGVQVLVNNAGYARAEKLLDISPDSFRDVLSTNISGAFFGGQVFGRYFAEQGHGRIVNMASLAGQNGGTATGSHYAAAKGGVLTLTKVFARDLAAQGVTVNAVSPGPVESTAVDEIVGAENVEAMRQSIPARTLGSQEFIAKVVVLLAGADAAGVTGACWDVNGGLYLR